MHIQSYQHKVGYKTLLFSDALVENCMDSNPSRTCLRERSLNSGVRIIQVKQIDLIIFPSQCLETKGFMYLWRSGISLPTVRRPYKAYNKDCIYAGMHPMLFRPVDSGVHEARHETTTINKKGRENPRSCHPQVQHIIYARIKLLSLRMRMMR